MWHSEGTLVRTSIKEAEKDAFQDAVKANHNDHIVERAALDRLRVAGAAARRTVVRGVRDATSAVHTCSKNHKTRQRGGR